MAKQDTPKAGNTCPECDRDLEGIDIVQHANDHWPLPDDVLKNNPQAYGRKKKLLAMAREMEKA